VPSYKVPPYEKEPEMFFKRFDKKEFGKKREGIYGKVISGKNAQLTWARLEPGQATDHTHNNEQIGYVLSGRLKVTIGNESETLGPGDAYCIPAGVRHGFQVVGDQKAEYLEVFSPPKKENLSL
jgi:quercetin dioxygenase-like cupin family protein